MHGTYHELTHWTGGKTRLNRTFGKRFGDTDYQFEELAAEMGSHQVTRYLGLPDFIHDREASYIASWIKGLRNEKHAILAAAAKAFEAFTYLQTFQQTDSEQLPIAA
jgi:antirestriction protein ArdC